MTIDSEDRVCTPIELFDSVCDRTVEHLRTLQCDAKIRPLVGPFYLVPIENDVMQDVGPFTEVQISRFLCIQTDIPFNAI